MQQLRQRYPIFLLASLLLGFLLIPRSATGFVAQPMFRSSAMTRSSLTQPGGLDTRLFLGGNQASSSAQTTIVELPAERVKMGSLRFLLQLEVVSRADQLWIPQQGDGDGELRLFFHDGTGMISIQMEPDCIRMVRNGKKPSLPYQLQESLLLHSLLDELDAVAQGGEEKVEVPKRLLVLEDDAAIDKARTKLPARKE